MIAKICWWCGGIADSSEHKIKRTDLIEVYGKGPFLDEEKLFYVVDEKSLPVQSAKSDFIKFKRSLCKECNNSRSSVFDKDYSCFISYIKSHYNEILNTQEVNFKTIFGEHWLSKKQNVIRYYLKHIGCQLSSDGISVPKEIKEFLNGSDKCDCLNYRFMLREYNKVFSDLFKTDSSKFEQLYIGNRRKFIERDIFGTKKLIFVGWKTVHWFSIDYVIERGITNKLYNKNPINSEIVKVELLRLEDYPSMLEVKDFHELIHRIEGFDRGTDESGKIYHLNMNSRE